MLHFDCVFYLHIFVMYEYSESFMLIFLCKVWMLHGKTKILPKNSIFPNMRNVFGLKQRFYRNLLIKH
jgi:hypothetical protein